MGAIRVHEFISLVSSTLAQSAAEPVWQNSELIGGYDNGVTYLHLTPAPG